MQETSTKNKKMAPIIINETNIDGVDYPLAKQNLESLDDKKSMLKL